MQSKFITNHFRHNFGLRTSCNINRIIKRLTTTKHKLGLKWGHNTK